MFSLLSAMSQSAPDLEAWNTVTPEGNKDGAETSGKSSRWANQSPEICPSTNHRVFLLCRVLGKESVWKGC